MHDRRLLQGEPIDTPAGVVRIVSRVDAYMLGGFFAFRHRPIAVEVTRDGTTRRHPIPDTGLLAAAVSYALLVMTTIFRRRR